MCIYVSVESLKISTHRIYVVVLGDLEATFYILNDDSEPHCHSCLSSCIAEAIWTCLVPSSSQNHVSNWQYRHHGGSPVCFRHGSPCDWQLHGEWTYTLPKGWKITLSEKCPEFLEILGLFLSIFVHICVSVCMCIYVCECIRVYVSGSAWVSMEARRKDRILWSWNYSPCELSNVGARNWAWALDKSIGCP